MILPVVVFGFGFGLALPLILTKSTELGPMKFRGILSSLIYSGIRIGQTTGPVLLGLLVMYSSLETVFLWTAVTTFMVVLIGFFGWKTLDKELY